jgi:hypothetical protein
MQSYEYFVQNEIVVLGYNDLVLMRLRVQPVELYLVFIEEPMLREVACVQENVSIGEDGFVLCVSDMQTTLILSVLDEEEDSAGTVVHERSFLAIDREGC